MNSERKICQNCKKDFQIESDDFAFYEKLKVPPPTWCPQCRFIRRLTFVNERSFYKRECGNCGTSTISIYNEDIPAPVWCVKCHISDGWDARDYAREYDFTRSFFEQFKDLKYSVPHRALYQQDTNSSGCEYSNFCVGSKDVYLSFNVHMSEGIMYSRYVLKRNKNCIDSLIFKENERGYELVQARQNYNSSFLVESDQCIESHFLYDCSNCVSCCLSSNLRNKSYVFRNKQLTKEEYKEAVSALRLDTYSGQEEIRKEFTTIARNAIHKYAQVKNSVNAIGDFIENSKNVEHCYGLVKGENLKNVFMGANKISDSQDVMFCGNLEECYEFNFGGGHGSRLVLSFSCGGGSKDMLYCDNCRSCSDCFGCEGLLKRQYCIFNKQYSKEEYFKLVGKIKKHMDEMPYIDALGRKYGFGEYFPTELSPFAYNETIAFEERPLSKEKLISEGHKWKDMEVKKYASTITSDLLPDSITDVNDSICDEIIECPNKGKVETQCISAFKILPDELRFYRQMDLPIPRYCPNCRYHKRLMWKNPFRFYERDCMCELSNHEHEGKCKNEFETMYAPERPEMIYCKECYQKEVY